MSTAHGAKSKATGGAITASYLQATTRTEQWAAINVSAYVYIRKVTHVKWAN